MAETKRGFEEITPEELDGVIERADSEGWTSLAIAGSETDRRIIPRWIEGYTDIERIFVMMEPADGLMDKISALTCSNSDPI